MVVHARGRCGRVSRSSSVRVCACVCVCGQTHRIHRGRGWLPHGFPRDLEGKGGVGKRGWKKVGAPAN